MVEEDRAGSVERAHRAWRGLPTAPVFMIIHCPHCKAQHVDDAQWREIPHRRHLCAGCGHVFMVREYPTVGVEILRG